MIIYLIREREDDKQKLVIEHKDKKLLFCIASFEKGVSLDDSVFRQLNSYWAGRSASTLDKIFNCYLQASEVFENSPPRSEMTLALTNICKDLCLLHCMQDIKGYVSYKDPNILIPAGLETTYCDSPDRPGSKEQTYLQEDYIDLVTFILSIKPLVPIWGEFITRSRQESGTLFKEYFTYKLIQDSEQSKSKAVKKLLLYIEKSVAMEKKANAAIIRGISSEDFPFWIMSLLVVRKLCVADISGFDQKNTLITLLYRFVTQKVKGTENSFNTLVKEKRFDESASDDSNLSRLESYKLRHELTPGDVIIMEHAVSCPFRLAKQLHPDISDALVQECLDTSKVLNHEEITQCQLTLLQWVLKPIVSPRGILYLSKPSIVRCLGVVQAVLMHTNHMVLAGISTARQNKSSSGFTVSSVDSRARIPKEMIEQISKLYPFEKRVGSRTKTRQQNQAISAIDKFCDDLSKFSWMLTASVNYSAAMNSGFHSKRFTVPHDIKVLTACLVIELASRKMP